MKRITLLSVVPLLVVILGLFTSCERGLFNSEEERLQQELFIMGDFVEACLTGNYIEGDSVSFVRETGEVEKFTVARCDRMDFWITPKPENEKDPPRERTIDDIHFHLTLKNSAREIRVYFACCIFHYEDEELDHPFAGTSITINTESYENLDIPYDIIHQQELSYSMENDSSVGFVMRKDVGIVRMWDNRGRTWTRPEELIE